MRDKVSYDALVSREDFFAYCPCCMYLKVDAQQFIYNNWISLLNIVVK